MSEAPRALLLVMMDVDPSVEEEFNRWYDEEHVPERLAMPGFISGRRFKAVEGGPKYLALYELESPEALQSEVYLRFVSSDRTEWTRRMQQEFRNFTRNVYVELKA